MAKQVQFRGGTTGEHSLFVGASREITVDTDKNTVVVHDGSTNGGFPLANVNANGNVAQAENALKLGGKSLEEVLQQNTSTILQAITLRDATKKGVSDSSESTIFGGTFTKKSNTSKIIATTTVFGNRFDGGNCGVGLRLKAPDNSIHWDFGVGYQYDGSWDKDQQTLIIVGTCQWENIDAGNVEIKFGWKTHSGAAGERPFEILNPNSSSDSRNQQFISSILIMEVE